MFINMKPQLRRINRLPAYEITTYFPPGISSSAINDGIQNNKKKQKNLTTAKKLFCLIFYSLLSLYMSTFHLVHTSHTTHRRSKLLGQPFPDLYNIRYTSRSSADKPANFRALYIIFFLQAMTREEHFCTYSQIYYITNRNNPD